MNYEASKFDVLYGKLLNKKVPQSLAKQLTVAVLKISDTTGEDVDSIIKYVTASGLRFDNHVYDILNNGRSNSSQIGFLDTANIPSGISRQVI
jgi:hypothetical protein